MKRSMIVLVGAVLTVSPAAAMDCGNAGEADTQAWLDSCLFALADDSAFGPMKAFGPNWIVAENQPCQLHNQNPQPNETVTWSGGCVDGKAHGEGRAEWRSAGSVTEEYVGSKRAGLSHGRGVVTSANGGRYEGDFVDGKPHGRGVFTWADGHRYKGEWSDGKMQGQGTYIHSNGVRIAGRWHNGKPHGQAVLTRSDGSRLTGQWRDGCHVERHNVCF